MTIDRIFKPTFLIVHGSWHRPCHYATLTSRLQDLGFDAVCPALPSIGKDRLNRSWQDDVLCIREVALALFEQNRHVVLVTHSYGGIPGAAATEGWTSAERGATDLPGGFCHVIFIAAFAVPVRGMSLIQANGGSFPDWMETGLSGVTKERSTFVNEKARAALYNDLSDAEAQWAMARLERQSQLAVETAVTFAAVDVVGPKTFVVCEQDAAMPVPTQEMLIAAVPGMRTARIDAGHSPFLSKPDECARLIAHISQAP